jgi:hypothetical protein
VFTTDVMLFHASLALELKDFARAVDILNAVVTSSPQDVHAVIGLADKHRTSHRGLEELCRKHMQPDVVEAMTEEGEDFQNFDHNEFSLHRDAKPDGIERSSSAPRPSSPTAQGEKPASRFAEERTKPAEKQNFIETRELSFDDDGTLDAPATTQEPVENPGDEIDAGVFETSRDLHVSKPGDAKPAPAPFNKPLSPPISKPVEKQAVPVSAPAPSNQARPAVKLRPAFDPTATDSHVANVATRLGEVGASAFFHIDDEEPVAESTPAPPRPPIDAAAYAHSSPAPEPAPAVEISQEPAMDEAARVVEEKLVEAAVETPAEPVPTPIDLIERALEDGRIDDLHDLLAFEPTNEAERFAQRLYEAEYHTLCNRPLPALEILTKLGAWSLSDEQKQRVWFRTAVCQRSMNDFAGANDTLKRLTGAFPGRPEYERLERLNYAQFVAGQASDVAVLQKTTSLD